MSNKTNFWDQLCGTILMKKLNIKHVDKYSLKLFDNAFLELYHYLIDVLRPEQFKGESVLEIGLGYGTIGQFLSAKAMSYTSLDFAKKPVKMMKQILKWQQNELSKVIQGDARELPFKDKSFDSVVSFGCFHHTGDIQKCIDESHSVLKPGGRLVMMIYSDTFFQRLFLRLSFFYKKYIRKNILLDFSTFKRQMYDVNIEGIAAPVTEFTSKNQLRTLLRKFN
jgi:ubiquinone/menaquinone biosynthesis C-methylase UbiE